MLCRETIPSRLVIISLTIKTEILWIYKETEVSLFGSRIKGKCDKSA